MCKVQLWKAKISLTLHFFFVNTKGLLSVVKKLRRRLHIRFLFHVAQNLIGEPARITFLRRGLVWQKRSLTAASPRIHPKPLHKPLFCSCHFPEEKPRAQDPRNPDTTGNRNRPMDRVRERTGKYSLDEDPITPDAPQAPSQATSSFMPLPPPRQHRHTAPLRPILLWV